MLNDLTPIGKTSDRLLTSTEFITAVFEHFKSDLRSKVSVDKYNLIIVSSSGLTLTIPLDTLYRIYIDASLNTPQSNHEQRMNAVQHYVNEHRSSAEQMLLRLPYPSVKHTLDQ